MEKFFPLVFPELKKELTTLQQLEKRISIGGLPSIYTSLRPQEDLLDYVQLYLYEEIIAEGLVRSYENFHRFLTVAGLTNSKQVKFTQIGSDAQISPRTIHDYFQIIEDTLIGFMLPAFIETPTRKAITSAKFYLFDTGVTNALAKRPMVKIGTPEFGELFEQYIISEVHAFLLYTGNKTEMFDWKSPSKLEVDLILKTSHEIHAIEIKSKNNPSRKDYRGLLAFAEDFPKAKKWINTLDSRHQLDVNKVEILPVLQFLELLWSGKLI